jgi:hypothetical protein
VKKLLLLLLIAVVGAGIAIGANAVFFSPSSDELPAIEPRGLIDEIAVDDVADEPTAEPALSPKPTPVAVGEETSSDAGASGGGSGAAPVPAPTDDGGPRDPRTPSGVDSGPQATSFVVQGVVDEQNPPDDPCDLEESEREQQQCENEAEREEDEREQEQDEDDSSNRDD